MPEQGPPILFEVKNPITGLPVFQVIMWMGQPRITLFNNEGAPVVEAGAHPAHGMGYVSVSNPNGEEAVALMGEPDGGALFLHYPQAANEHTVRVEISAEELGADLKLFDASNGECVSLASAPQEGVLNLSDPDTGVCVQLVADSGVGVVELRQHTKIEDRRFIHRTRLGGVD
jgi:hypothetical protein